MINCFSDPIVRDQGRPTNVNSQVLLPNNGREVFSFFVNPKFSF